MQRLVLGHNRPWLAILALALCAMLAGAAPDTQAKARKNGAATSHQGHQTKSPGKTTPSPSEETRAERERRLFRECKGMHNAGACKGYTRK